MKASCLSNDLRLLTGSTAVDCCVARTLLPKDHQGACEQQVSTGSITPTRAYYKCVHSRPMIRPSRAPSAQHRRGAAARGPSFNDVVHAHCILPDRDVELRRRAT